MAQQGWRWATKIQRGDMASLLGGSSKKKGKLERLQWFSEAHEEGPRAFCSLYTMCEMVSLLVVEQKVELLREKASSRERDSQMVLICAKAFVLLF